jgi:hypothetical protein
MPRWRVSCAISGPSYEPQCPLIIFLAPCIKLSPHEPELPPLNHDGELEGIQDEEPLELMEGIHEDEPEGIQDDVLEGHHEEPLPDMPMSVEYDDEDELENSVDPRTTPTPKPMPNTASTVERG